jgi:hypothetical protein
LRPPAIPSRALLLRRSSSPDLAQAADKAFKKRKAEAKAGGSPAEKIELLLEPQEPREATRRGSPSSDGKLGKPPNPRKKK